MGSDVLTKLILFFNLCFAVIGFAAIAQGSTITEYTDQTSFDAVAGQVLVDTFGTQTCFQISQPINNSTLVPVCAYDTNSYIHPGEIQPGVTYSATYMDSNQLYFNIDSGGGFSTPFLDALSINAMAPDALTAAFSNPVSSIGFLTGNDIMGSTFSITFTFTGGSTQTLSNISIPDFNAYDYYGFTSTATNIMSVSIQGISNSTALDNFTFSSSANTPAATPEPAMLAAPGLLILGLYAGLLRRKREKHVAGNA